MRSIPERITDYPKGEHWSDDTSDRRDLRVAGRAIEESLSPLERLEMLLHPWVGFAIVPLFALANAGVAFSGVALNEPASGAIFAGLVIGQATEWPAFQLAGNTPASCFSRHGSRLDVADCRSFPDRHRVHNVDLYFEPGLLFGSPAGRQDRHLRSLCDVRGLRSIDMALAHISLENTMII